MSESVDFKKGYEMGYMNGGRDDDAPWWPLNPEESRGYQLGFAEGWRDSFGS